ncbi:hypothetical protein B4N89_03390 [Embleya scabrispora]|uniref:Uncharacterized protein n=1 Tax=Embleya scabrispora TaxID=159449 RepID=A0A1T3NTV3_9ACTN|nr:hypothetical protein B4N89_03390 [Embleya scabrispora]
MTVDCAGRIATQAAPPVGYTVLLGDVALETDRRLQTSRTTGAESAHPLFAKSGLVVRGGTVVDLEVVPTPGHGAAIGWGNRDTTAGAIRVPDCTEGTTGTGEPAWVAFAGGFHVDRPGCVTLIVRSRGLRTRAHIPVGADC